MEQNNLLKILASMLVSALWGAFIRQAHRKRRRRIDYLRASHGGRGGSSAPGPRLFQGRRTPST
jgi:hypothetical protein